MTARIVVSLLDERQDYSKLQAEDAKATAARRAVSVDVLFAENNALVQIQQLFSRIHAPEAERPAASGRFSTATGRKRVPRPRSPASFA